jgi:hypothetical protein
LRRQHLSYQEPAPVRGRSLKNGLSQGIPDPGSSDQTLCQQALTGLVLIFPVAATSFITLSLGFTAVLLSGRHHAWIIYLFATYQLARQHRLPRRLMPFLDDAHRLGLLRTVGPIYQFRHADLQDHLAATYRPHD